MSASKVPSIVHGLSADGQYVGTCQACFGQYVVKQAKSGESRAGSGDGFEKYRSLPLGSLVVVLHGYSRPGHGHTEGECPGRGAEPFELSKDLTEKFKRQMQDRLQTTLAFIEKLKTGTMTLTLLKFNRQQPEAIQISPGWRDGYRTYESELRSKIRENEGFAHNLVEDIKYINERLGKWKYDPQKLIDGRPRKIGIREEDQQAAEAAVSSRNRERDDKEKKTRGEIDALLNNEAFMAYLSSESPATLKWLDKAKATSSQAKRIQELKSWFAEAKRTLAEYRRSRPEQVGKSAEKLQQIIREIEAYISNERLEAYMRGVYEGFINMSAETNYYDHEVKLFEYRRDSRMFNLDERVRALKMTLKTFKQFAAEASPPIKVSLPK